MDITSSGLFQRVFTWRWNAPKNQEAFALDFAELERVWEDERAAHRAELDADRDLEGDVAQLDVPYPGLGRVDKDGRPQRGGKIDREPPQLSLLVGCCPPPEKATRLALETGYEDATSEQLAQRLDWVFKHRGRPEGLSRADYAAQRELTVARSIGWAFLEHCKDLPSIPVIWSAKFGSAALILGYLLWGRSLGRAGLTASGKNWRAVLPGRTPGEPLAMSTVWAWLQRLERAGYLIRLRRWKPGINGRPVALTANWYGLGPRALADLAGGAVDRPEVTIQRQRARVKRRHLRAEGRRRGVDLLAGYSFPTLPEYAAQVLDAWTAAQQRDEARARAWKAGIVPSDWSGAARRPSFVFDLAADELDQFERLGVVATDAAEAVELSAVEHPEGLSSELDCEVFDPLEPELERGPNDDGIAEVRRLLRRAREEEDSKIQPGSTGGARTGRGGHRPGVARPRPSIPAPGRQTFEARCANARPGGTGCVSGRDSRDRPPAIPIRLMDAPPLGCETNIRNGPEAGGAAARKSRDNERDKPAQARGPLTEAVSAETTAFLEVQDRRLAGLLVELAKARGFVVS